MFIYPFCRSAAGGPNVHPFFCATAAATASRCAVNCRAVIGGGLAGADSAEAAGAKK
jgi:hypothetical protein